ncbi:Tryptophan-tRNA ligase, mitochondrial [Smittium culicis]|uniref:Tryptophan-tRNA ligase, mitochondrial n=1 Tax=Smittium culicis TaxID=133412 RepID=A0A1R1XUL5_9FUNG|nr:Tryptophan-tRNA ligase, mitochondrial [Smittium culicis]
MLKSGIRIVSGIQPTGIPHLGNYLGSIANWVSLQNSKKALVNEHNLQKDSFKSKFNSLNEKNISINNFLTKTPVLPNNCEINDLFFFIADLHAVTIPDNIVDLKASTLELASVLLACGIDPSKSHLFRQSAIPSHAELMWILSCITPIGSLNRMTQWKVIFLFVANSIIIL